MEQSQVEIAKLKSMKREHLWTLSLINDPGDIGLRDRAVTVRASISNSRTSHQHHQRRTICAFSFYDAKPF
jgi:hypothetical protein